MLISPTEPAPLRTLGTTSSVPETVGVDYLQHSPALGLVGVQRKELNDLVASVQDGRLSKELAQMKRLAISVLLLEGRWQWTSDGYAITNTSWTRAQHHGLIWSVQLSGYWIASVETMAESMQWLSLFQKWLEKSTHGSLAPSRPKASSTSAWGKADNRDFGIHLLQSFDGVGTGTAASIFDHFGGVPLQWTVNEKELQEVKGVGKGRAKALVNALPPLPPLNLVASSPSSSSSRTGNESKNGSMGELVYTDLT